MATIQELDTIITELIELAVECGANPNYITKIIAGNGFTLVEAYYRNWISHDLFNKLSGE